MYKKIMVTLLCAALFLSIAAGCSNNENTPSPKPTESSSTPAPTEEAKNLTELFDTVEDSSDLPDWNDETLTLRVWNGHGTGDANRDLSSDDVVNPEMERIFGIEIDSENSFDNGGQDLPSKMAVLATTNDWPEIGMNVMNQDIIDAEKLYDLTELLPVYAPHYYEFLQKKSPKSISTGFNGTKKLYGINYFGNDVETMATLYDNVDLDKYKYIAVPQDRLGLNTQVYVRDDILKLAYPEAKTQDEIEALYMENGEFTREDLYDVPVTSKEEAFEFFYNIKKAIDDNKITEDGRPVSATFAFSGQDNWALLACLWSGINGLPNTDYFTFFNVQDKKVKMMFMEEEFKQDLLHFNNFVRDGIASEASLIENNEIFTNKLNNGEYAISYAWLMPDDAVLKSMSKPYRYRKVYFDIPQDTTFGLNQKEESNMSRGGISIFKDAVKEEDVPRILQYLDYFYTEPGMKLVTWGPRSAGLFTEENGVRKYTDPELEACMVYGEKNDADLKYNLANGDVEKRFMPEYPKLELGVAGGGLQNPRYIYDLSSATRQPGNANTFFQSGLFDQQVRSGSILKCAFVWNYTDEVEGMKQFWDVRGTGFEPMMTKVLASKSDEEFEKAYDKMVKYAVDNGLTDATMDAINKLMQDKYSEDWATMQAGFDK